MIHTARHTMRRFAILLGLSLLTLPAKAEVPRVLIVKATAYTSSVRETDATPFITATGARTRYGIIAVSRDLLNTDLPYGSLVKIEDLGRWQDGAEKGKYNPMLEDVLFVVEDTMHQRKHQQIDIWMPDRSLALRWGVRRVKLTIVRYGR